jgi:hypothetical protein
MIAAINVQYNYFIVSNKIIGAKVHECTSAGVFVFNLGLRILIDFEI